MTFGKPKGMPHGTAPTIKASPLEKALVSRRMGGSGSGLSLRISKPRSEMQPNVKPLESDMRKRPLLPRIFDGYR